MFKQGRKKKQDIRLLIACHKPCAVPEDEIYLPLHVGCEGKDPIGFTGDNTGDNISLQNPMFCELTGLYWAWKNLHCDVLGLVHYRRYFTLHPMMHHVQDEEGLKSVLSGSQVRFLMRRYKVIVPQKRYYVIESIDSHYRHTLDGRQLDETRAILSELHPEYLQSFDTVMARRSAYMFNMFIAPKEMMDGYCQWLFSILFPLTERLGSEGMSAFEKRYPGRISELLWNVYLEQLVRDGKLRSSEIHAVPYLYLGKIDWARKAKSFLAAKFLHKKYESSF